MRQPPSVGGMTSFQTDTDAVVQTAASTRAAVDRMQADAVTLAAQLHQLQAIWTGQAATAFQQLSDDWFNANRRVEEVLAALAAALNQAGQHYAEAEAQALRLFAR